MSRSLGARGKDVLFVNFMTSYIKFDILVIKQIIYSRPWADYRPCSPRGNFRDYGFLIPYGI